MEVSIESSEWKKAVDHNYPEKSGQMTFPLASLLKIATLRPITKDIFDALCEVSGTSNQHARVLEQRLTSGQIDDVPDLLKLLLEDEGKVEGIVKHLFEAIPPLKPRLYSVANSPAKEGMESKVSIVISRLWYHVGSTAKRRKSLTKILGGSDDERVGVCTSFLLNDSLYKYVPLRIVEAERFHLPHEDEDGDIMMIALGSGASPMFAFLEELLSRKDEKIRNVYFCWGLPSPSNLFGIPLLERAIDQIGLKFCISFSREARTVEVHNGKITIVPGQQERITAKLASGSWANTIARMARGTGIIYLCGHPMLENTVRSTIEHALRECQNLSLQESAAQYVRMVAAKRIRSDLYYSGSRHSTDLPFYSITDVARHNNLDDIWWIYKVRIDIFARNFSPLVQQYVIRRMRSHHMIFKGRRLRCYRLYKHTPGK